MWPFEKIESKYKGSTRHPATSFIPESNVGIVAIGGTFVLLTLTALFGELMRKLFNKEE